MSNLDKYIEMLASSKSSSRYEACEMLRVSGESSLEAVAALERATTDTDKSVAEAAMKALESDVHKFMKLGFPSPVEQERIRKEQELEHKRQAQDRSPNIILSTTPFLDGFSVKQYLGIVTAEIVIGTGWFSETGAAISDFFGVRANEFETKLQQAKDLTLSELRMKAAELEADAVLSLDLDYSVLGKNMLMVVANGTAVALEPRNQQE